MTNMARALTLARRAVGSVSPNPAVGAVIVRDEAVVGEGWTQPPGQAHAEAMALQQAGSRSVGAALYCTLEPCNQFGRTPPCTTAIIDAGISEVHASVLDPNPAVNGGGLSQLAQAGIKTCVGEGEEEARHLIEAYAKFINTGLPFVTAKFAMSLDGKIATHTGDSKWITGPVARTYVHRLRAATDSIMVGINTVLADDPQLTTRDERGHSLARQPLRILVDSTGRLPPGARALSEPGRTLAAVSRIDDDVRCRLAEAGAEVESVPAQDGSVDLEELFRSLGQRGVTSVLVEGGGTLLGSLFDRRLVDKVVAFVAPIIIGGRSAPSPVEGAGVVTMAEALRLHHVKTMEFDNDVAVIGYCEAEPHVYRNR